MDDFFSSLPFILMLTGATIVIIPLTHLQIEINKSLRGPNRDKTARMIAIFYGGLAIALIGLALYANR